MELPSGTVTFLFTDIEGSTRRWEEQPASMATALALHNAILDGAIDRFGGVVVSRMGDGVAVAFPGAADAVAAAVAAQVALQSAQWPEESGPLWVRMGLHTDDAEVRDGEYLAQPLNRCARLMAAAHGGQVLLSGATETLVRSELPRGVTLLDLGEHWFRDITQPTHVYQVCHPALRSSFPPPRSLNAVAGNLPARVTSFVGREGDMAAVRSALAVNRLVTLTGSGGVGKTSLAVQVATDLVHEHRDGCWLCELAPSTAETMLQVVATTLGVTPRQGLSLEESIVDYLRTKQMLLTLDNCEHVLPGVRPFAIALIRSCPGLRLLATSREPLQIEGEQVWQVGPLPVGPAVSSLEEVARRDATRLFVDRARAVRPDFVLDDSNAAAVVQIVRRLDGNPLAIELAAARTAAASPAQIVQLLDERFRLLTRRQPEGPERQHSLRNAVDWSYSLLTADERSTFCRLGVFVGSFDAPAATAVVGGDSSDALDVLDALTSLVAKSMVVADVEPDGGTRYRLLETLRQYALERLGEHDQSEQGRRTHADFYASWAESAGPALIGPDELVWRPRLRAELDNLRAAAQWSLSSPGHGDDAIAVRIAAALAAYAVHESAGDLASIVERTVTRARAAPPGPRRAVLGAAAFAAFQNRGDIDLAERLAREALEGGVGADCPAPQHAHAALVMSFTFTGRLDEAHVALDAGVREMEQIGAGSYHRAMMFQTAAVANALTGDVDRARSYADRALSLAREVGNPSELAAALWAGSFVRVRNEPKQSLDFAEESIALTRAGASGASLGHTLAIRAQLLAERGDVGPALRDLAEAVSYSIDKGDRVMLMVAFDRGVTVFGLLEEAEAAAVLEGVTVLGPLATLSILPQDERNDRDALLDRVRHRLGNEAYVSARTRGATMSVDAVVGYVVDKLGALDAAVGANPGDARPFDG